MLGAQLRLTAVARVATAVTAVLARADLGSLGTDEAVAGQRIAGAPTTHAIPTRATIAADGRMAAAIGSRP